MLRELSAGITGQARPAGSLGQVAAQNSISMPIDGEQENEEEVVFETKTEGLSGKKYTITVNLKEGKLTFKKQGIWRRHHYDIVPLGSRQHLFMYTACYVHRL